MRTNWKSLFAAAVVLASAGTCLADQIDNPQYKSWAKFKEGTSVTMHSDSDMGGNKTATDITTTLKTLTADKATVEIKMSMVMAGNKMDMPPRDQDVPAKIDKPATTDTTTPKPDVKEGTDSVDISGKSYSCKTIEATMTNSGMTTNSKTWTCDDIPGGMVKSESTFTGTMAGTNKMAVTAVDIK